jgi:tetratricopeptide (TPR) repeat protein
LRTKNDRSIEKQPENSKLLILCATILALLNVVSCQNQAAETLRGVDLGDAKAAAEKVSEADKLYPLREDLAKIRQAVALVRQARSADYGSFEAAWKLAQFDYYLGEHTTDWGEREAVFREGIEAGKAAVRLQPERPEGHFWLGANYGGSAEHSTLASLSSVHDIQTEMAAVLKLNEGFQFGSAYLVLGQLYLKAPRMLGGNSQKAVENLEKGLRFGANNGLLRLRLAEAYHAVGRDADARKQIDALQVMTPDPMYVPEQKEAIEKAQKLLEQLRG